MVADAKIYVNRLARRYRSSTVMYLDDVGEPAFDDDRYVHLPLWCEGERVAIVVFTAERFYAALGKVMAHSVPGAVGVPIN